MFPITQNVLMFCLGKYGGTGKLGKPQDKKQRASV